MAAEGLLLLQPFEYEKSNTSSAAAAAQADNDTHTLTQPPPLVFTENEWDDSPVLSPTSGSNIDLFADLDLVEVSFPPPPPPTPDTIASIPSEKPFVDESVTADLLGMLLQAYQPPMQQQQQHQEQQHPAPVATV
ncbi:predicted protein [Lichtheimia corymbifera JMRC:FSU:9682]|uniref:Uncharacterized protein n=1 Tax=Lichtheimia corymbifera JMRC:FSU:9682 TaxID=1263082 RepID=A0A068RI94_9FUNG|nr:predicted protein [Lichtheimia corymbifera JMRC:FSU:9682]